MVNSDNDWDLHAIIIKKDIPLKDAIEIASKFTHNKFYRITNDSYRFRNIPKTKFNEFRTKIINNNISLVYGKYR